MCSFNFATYAIRYRFDSLWTAFLSSKVNLIQEIIGCIQLVDLFNVITVCAVKNWPKAGSYTSN